MFFPCIFPCKLTLRFSQERVLKLKSWRKQTSLKIQFYSINCLKQHKNPKKLHIPKTVFFWSSNFTVLLKHFSVNLKSKAFVRILDGGCFILQMEWQLFSRLNIALFAYMYSHTMTHSCKKWFFFREPEFLGKFCKANFWIFRRGKFKFLAILLFDFWNFAFVNGVGTLGISPHTVVNIWEFTTPPSDDHNFT